MLAKKPNVYNLLEDAVYGICEQVQNLRVDEYNLRSMNK